MSQPIPQWAVERGVLDQTDRFAMVPITLIKEVQDLAAIGLYAILKSFADYQSGLAYPSRALLAEMAGYKTLRPVDNAIEVLRKAGYVATFARFKDRDGRVFLEPGEGRAQTANGYILTRKPMPTGEEKDPTPMSSGTHPLYPTGDTPLYPVGHTPYSPGDTRTISIDLEPEELEETPPNPPRGEAAPARREPAQAPAAEKSAKRGEYLPEGWMPPRAAVEALRAKYPHVDQRLEFEKFTDYWRAASGQRARKRDWVAAYRTWIRNAASFAPTSAPAGYGSTPRVGTSPEEWLATLKQPPSDVIEGEVIGDALE